MGSSTRLPSIPAFRPRCRRARAAALGLLSGSWSCPSERGNSVGPLRSSTRRWLPSRIDSRNRKNFGVGNCSASCSLPSLPGSSCRRRPPLRNKPATSTATSSSRLICSSLLIVCSWPNQLSSRVPPAMRLVSTPSSASSRSSGSQIRSGLPASKRQRTGSGRPLMTSRSPSLTGFSTSCSSAGGLGGGGGLTGSTSNTRHGRSNLARARTFRIFLRCAFSCPGPEAADQAVNFRTCLPTSLLLGPISTARLRRLLLEKDACGVGFLAQLQGRSPIG